MERCPCCNARLTGAVLCPRCQADLGAAITGEQLAKHWLQSALPLWLAHEPQMAIMALNKSIKLKQTPLAWAFRDFIIRQQYQHVLGLLDNKHYAAAQESFAQLRDVAPDNEFIRQLNGFMAHFLAGPMEFPAQ